MTKPVKVCLLNDSFPPLIDGVANAVYNYAKVIHNGLGSAVVATPYYPKTSDNTPFPVVRYPSLKTPKTAGYRTGLPFPAKTVRDIIKHKPDIIHCHCPFVSSMLAKSLRAASGAPVVFTYHTKFDVDIAKTLESQILQATARRFIVSNIEASDEVWVVSRGAGENLRGLGYRGAYRVVNNGVDFARGRSSGDETEQLLRELKAEKGTPVFLFVGRMMWYKGIKTIIDGLAMAKRGGAKFKMVFIGGGSDFDAIKAYSGAAGLKGDCVFTGSVYDRARLRVYFTAADMFLFPSTYDTNGIVVREAAACGLASVLIRDSAAAEGVVDGQNGFLIDDNPRDLARIASLVTENRAHFKQAGDRAMRELYISWEDAVTNAYNHYLEILDDRKPNYKRKARRRHKSHFEV